MLIDLYARTGDKMRALRQYGRLRNALREELDVEPTAAVIDIAARHGLAWTDDAATQSNAWRRMKIQFATTTDGVKIAYWRMGSGAPFVQLPMGALSHIAMETDLPWMRRWYAALADRYEVIRYDMRGFGSSDRSGATISPDSELRDLGAVVARVGGSKRRVLFATLSQGRVAIRYAARHPEAVGALILWNSDFARHGRPFGRDEESLFQDVKVRDWNMFVSAWAVAVWGWARSDQARLWSRLMRDEASPEALDAFNAARQQDVTEDLRDVRVPTLVVCHASFVGSVEAGREIASQIPHARLEELSGIYAPWVDQSHTDEALALIDDFLSDLV